MKILITAPSLDTSKNVSGISTVVNTIIENNFQHRYYHYLLGRPDKTKGLTYIFTFFKQLFCFPIALYRNKIDLVHQNFPFDPKGLMRESVINFWCYLFRIPVILHIHGGQLLMQENKNRIWRFFVTVLFSHSRQVIVLSDLERDALIDLHGFADAVVLANSITVKDYTNENRTFSAEKPTFLFLGRLHESKGLDDILQAFIKMKEMQIAFRFIMCGTGPLEHYCKSNFQELLGTDFEFRGIVSGTDKRQAFKDADFFLLPSRYGEGLPMALLEAMASGLVPIVTDDASMKYVVQPLVNGVRVDKYDGIAMAVKIQEVLGNPSKVIEMQEQAVETVLKSYDIQPYISKLNVIYKTIMVDSNHKGE